MRNYQINDTTGSLDDAIINAIESLRSIKKRPDETAIYNYIKKQNTNNYIIKNDVTNRIVTLIVTNKLSNNKTNAKNSLYVNSVPTSISENYMVDDNSFIISNTKLTPPSNYNNCSDTHHIAEKSHMINDSTINVFDSTCCKLKPENHKELLIENIKPEIAAIIHNELTHQFKNVETVQSKAAISNLKIEIDDLKKELHLKNEIINQSMYGKCMYV